MVVSLANLNIRRIRSRTHLTQRQFAAAPGISLRALHSYEQGWRPPPTAVQRLLLLLWIIHRNGRRVNSVKCWELKDCGADCRRRCVAYLSGQGHLCWLLTGTVCEGRPKDSWSEKRLLCAKCKVMAQLMGDG